MFTRYRLLLPALCLMTGAAFAQQSTPTSVRHPTPPPSMRGTGMAPPQPGQSPEAAQACAGKMNGASVSVSGPNGTTNQITCGQGPGRSQGLTPPPVSPSIQGNPALTAPRPLNNTTIHPVPPAGSNPANGSLTPPPASQPQR